MNRLYYPLAVVRFLVLILVAGLSCEINAQGQKSSGISYPFAIWMEPETDFFADIQEKAEAWFEGKDKGRGTGYKQWKRWEFLNQNRLTGDGKITNYAARNFDAFLESNGSRVANGDWWFIAANSYTNGPSGYSGGLGRVNCVAFHPSNPDALWVGLPSGGLWHTSNNGGTWTPLSDGLPTIGVSGIVIHPSNPDMIWILTGDGDAGDTKSIGVLKSTNGGLTWYTTGLSWDVTENVRGYKLMADPLYPDELWAVTNFGLYKTNDGGLTWTNMKSGSYRDLEFKPGASNTMYLSSSNSFYNSTDGGTTWNTITSGLPTGESRIAIGVTPANPNYVFLLCGPGGSGGSGTYKGFYWSADSGNNFSTESTTPNILGNDSGGGGTSDQSWYDLSLAISRTTSSHSICGGINTWRSTNFGYTWTITSHWSLPNGIGYTHADIHALEINPLNNRLYCCSDGGIFYSDDFGDNWTDISSGLGPGQFYKLAGYPGNTEIIIAGAQDNGSNNYVGSHAMVQMYGGDGMDCMIDYTNSNIMYFSTQHGGLRKSTNGGNTSTYIAPTSGPWVTQYIMHPTNPSIIYGGFTGGIYKSTNAGSTWTNIGGVSSAQAMVHGVDNPNIIYASSGLTLYRSSNGGSTWTTISGGLPNNSITAIEVDHQNANEVWVTFAGYTANQKVYKTEDASAGTVVWNNISGTLPNTVINCIQNDINGSDDAIYIGTDIGVFYRDATLGEWVPFSNWLPVVMVFDIEITSNILTVATYGRGIWRSGTYSECQSSWYLIGQGAAGYSYYQASDSIASSRQFNQGVGQEGIFKAANKVRLQVGFNVSNGSAFKGMIGPCGADIPGPDESTGIPAIGVYAGPMPGLDEKQN